MEQQKQELLRLIDNLDWDMMQLFKDKSTHEPPFLDNIIEYFKRYQKQPTIEQQLEEIGFQHNVWDIMQDGLNWLNEGGGTKRLYYKNSMANTYINGHFPHPRSDFILSFAKYLKELKEKDEK